MGARRIQFALPMQKDTEVVQQAALPPLIRHIPREGQRTLILFARFIEQPEIVRERS